MNWSKSGSGRAASFGGSVDYVLHDKDERTKERVGGIDLINLATDNPDRAGREMEITFQAAAAIKARAGVKAGKTEKPAYVFSLSWHPDDRPDGEHMKKTARSALGLLGLSEHQAIVVEHKDRPHKHVHIIVNLIHPETGKTARLYQDERKLDRWAHEYELGRSMIRSFGRAAKYERTHAMEREPSKDILDRKEKVRALREELTAKRDALAEKHKTAAEARTKEKKQEWDCYRKQRDDIKERMKELKAPDIPEKVKVKKQPIAKARKQETPTFEYNLEGERPRVPRREWQQLAKALAQTKTLFSGLIRQGRKSVFDLPDHIRMGQLRQRFVKEAQSLYVKSVPKMARPGLYIDLAVATHKFEQQRREMDARHKKELAKEHNEKMRLRAETTRKWADLRKELGLLPIKDQWQRRRDELKAEHQRVSKAPERPTVKEHPVRPNASTRIPERPAAVKISRPDGSGQKLDLSRIAASRGPIRPGPADLGLARPTAGEILPTRPKLQIATILSRPPERPTQTATVQPTPSRPTPTTITTPATPAAEPARIVTNTSWERSR